MKRLVLASESPRRRNLIKLLGLSWILDRAEISEQFDQSLQSLGSIAETLALEKAHTVAARHPNSLVLGADTIVVLGSTPYGKPSSQSGAKRMLQALRARTHKVITGIALVDTGRGMTRVIRKETVVTMRNYTEEEIDSYLASGAAMDKAGSYAIQDEIFHPAKQITGCFTNVIGLPLCSVERALIEFDVPSKLSVGWKQRSQSLCESHEPCPNCVALNLKLQVF